MKQLKSVANLLQLSRKYIQSSNVISDRIGIIGVPFDKGQTKKGVAYGPDAIREGNLLKHLQAISSKDGH